jgi:hypothetical protein
MTKEKQEILNKLDETINGIDFPGDRSYTINSTYRIDIFVTHNNKGEYHYQVFLMKDNLDIVSINGVPLDEIEHLIYDLRQLIYSLDSKLITNIDVELVRNNGWLEYGYKGFQEDLPRLSRLSRVTQDY